MKSVKVQKKLTLSALFASLICAGCFIQIPLPGGVPIVIQDMMAMLSGLLLGPVFGGLAVLLFLLLGTVGLPVFTGKAGLHVLLAGPTSGFLWGYFFAAVIGGTILALFELTQKHAADKSGQNEASPEPQAKKKPRLKHRAHRNNNLGRARCDNHSVRVRSRRRNHRNAFAARKSLAALRSPLHSG